jgi:hypothetical protein
MIGEIELTRTEQELVGKIVFDVLSPRALEAKEINENGERAAALMMSLIHRKAIPEQRLRYFTDPDYNPGPGRASRFDNFRANAGSKDEVFRHPHFLPYLHYFIYGSDLPSRLKEEFLAKTESSWVKEHELSELARQLVRKYDLPRHPGNYRLKDEFYQLALDCDCDERVARSVREAVMKVK